MAVGWRGQYLRYREFYLNILAIYKQRADLRAFLEIVLSLTTIIIFLIFALKPTALTIISLYGQIQEKQKTAAGLDKKISDLQVASGVFAGDQSLIPDVDLAVSGSPQPDLLAKQIQADAAKNSVSILGISVGETVISGAVPAKKSSSEVKPLPGGAKEMPISISAKGDYPALSSFLKDIENFRTIINLDSVVITASVSEGGRVIVAVISGRVPFLGQ